MSDPKEPCACACHADQKRAAHDPDYRRALWIVLVANLGFGLIEIIGGFIAGSQALKADALDFLGDGSITLVGLFALSWAESTRARVALAQGSFLALLGLGVIGMAAGVHSTQSRPSLRSWVYGVLPVWWSTSPQHSRWSDSETKAMLMPAQSGSSAVMTRWRILR